MLRAPLLFDFNGDLGVGHGGGGEVDGVGAGCKVALHIVGGGSAADAD